MRLEIPPPPTAEIVNTGRQSHVRCGRMVGRKLTFGRIGRDFGFQPRGGILRRIVHSSQS